MDEEERGVVIDEEDLVEVIDAVSVAAVAKAISATICLGCCVVGRIAGSVSIMGGGRS